LRCAALVVVGLLAGASVFMSDLPAAFAVPAGLGVAAYAAWLARRDWRQPPATLVWRAGEEQARLVQPGCERILSSLNVRWRGPLATLGARDEAGKLRRLSWWPDTLPASARRDLRLVSDRRAPRKAASAAPRAATGASP
jgi:toxin CptA